MGDFVTLTCPNCGGRLQVTPDLDRFACAFCGAEHLVKRGGGIVSLSPVIDAIGKVQTSVDVIVEDIQLRREKQAKSKEKVASKREIVRLTKEIDDSEAAIVECHVLVMNLRSSIRWAIVRASVFFITALLFSLIALIPLLLSSKPDSSSNFCYAFCISLWIGGGINVLSIRTMRTRIHETEQQEVELIAILENERNEIQQHEKIVSDSI